MQITKNESFFIYLVTYSSPTNTIQQLGDRVGLLNQLFETVHEFEKTRAEIQKQITELNRNFSQNDAVIEKQKGEAKHKQKVKKLREENKEIFEKMETLNDDLSKLGLEVVDVEFDSEVAKLILESSVQYIFGENPVVENIQGKGDMEIYFNLHQKL